jgi:hypothetical protein
MLFSNLVLVLNAVILIIWFFLMGKF